MNQEPGMKMTELDYLTAAPHLQMIKAALPYIHIPEQRFFSLMVKIKELERTMRLLEEKETGEVGICSLKEDEPATPIDMLNAMKPYGTEEEQDFIDLVINFMQGSRLYQSYRETAPEEEEPHRAEHRRFPMEQLMNILPPEQQSRLETAQMLVQTFQQFS